MKPLIVTTHIVHGAVYFTKHSKLENGMYVTNGERLAKLESCERGTLDGAACNDFKEIVATSEDGIDLPRVSRVVRSLKDSLSDVFILRSEDGVNPTLNSKGEVQVMQAPTFNLDEVWSLCQQALATPCSSSKIADSWCEEYLIKDKEEK